MAELSRLKKFMLCTFIVAVASFMVMFYYSVNFSKYTRLGVKYVTTIKNGNLGRDLQKQALFSNNSTASSNPSDTGNGASKEGKIDVVNSIEHSVRLQPSEQKSVVFEDKKALQNTSNSSKGGSTIRLSTEAIKPTTSTARQPILTPSSAQSNIAQELCPEKSSSLGKSLFYVTALVT